MTGVVLSIAYWVASSLVIGLACAHIPVRILRLLGRSAWWLRCPSPHWYRKAIYIGLWKDRVPEAGRFGGGVSKRHLKSRDRGVLERLYLETIRAELVHTGLLMVQCFPIVWLKGGLLVLPIGYAVVANLPFIAIQRYNRARLSRLVGIEDRRILDE